MSIGTRLVLAPTIEVGLRHDRGDAENGAGLDVGGGLVFTDAESGLSIDLRVRTLVVHQAEGFAERSLSVAVNYDPSPATPLGLTARVAPAWGGETGTSAEALWATDSIGAIGGHRAATQRDNASRPRSATASRSGGGVRRDAAHRPPDLRIRPGLPPAATPMGVLEARELRLQIGIEAEQRQMPSSLLPNQGGGREQRVVGQATVEW